MGYLDKGTNKWIYNDGTDNGAMLMSDGSIRAVGTARVWDDILGNLFGQKLNSSVGRVDYNWNENTITFQNNGSINTLGDRVQMNFQFPHSTYFGSGATMDLHFHWKQDSTNTKTITVKYRVQENGQPVTTAWTTITADLGNGNDVFTYTGGTLNQITEIITLDIEGLSLSDIVEFQIARTDGTTGNLEATFIDGHVQIDSDGSVDEYMKDGMV